MQSGNRHQEPDARLASVMIGGCTAIILVSIVGAFLGLDQSSLWLDELFTAYFSDPVVPAGAELFHRVAEDIHPPIYYLMIWAAMKVFGGEFTIVARAMSAVLCVLTLPILYWALPKSVGHMARLAACTYASTTYVWYYYAQEARSYALVFLILTILIGLLLRIRAALDEGQDPKRWLVAFALTGVLAGLTHYYLVPLVGAMVAALILYADRWTARAIIAGTGLALLVPIVAYISWHMGVTVHDPTDTWFEATNTFLISRTLLGVRLLIGSGVEAIILLGLLVAAFVGPRVLNAKGDERRSPGARSPDIKLLLWSGGIYLALLLIITLFFVPIYSHRTIVVLAPVLWIFVGILSDRLGKVLTRRTAGAAGLAFLVLVAIASTKVVWRDVPKKEPWQASAAVMAQIPECKEAILPVVVHQWRYMKDEGPDRLYGYYMPDEADWSWLPVALDDVMSLPNLQSYKDVFAARISGADPCPVLLWSVPFPLDFEELRATLQKVSGGAKIVLREFELPNIGRFRSFVGDKQPNTSAYMVLVERQ